MSTQYRVTSQTSEDGTGRCHFVVGEIVTKSPSTPIHWQIQYNAELYKNAEGMEQLLKSDQVEEA